MSSRRVANLSRGYRWLAAIALLVAVLSVFLGARRCQLLDLDDNVNLYRNLFIADPGFSSLIHFWTGPTERLYAPVTYTVWLLTRFLDLAFLVPPQSWDFTDSLYHEVNLLFHWLNAFLVFLILRRLVRQNLAACLGALLFATHPLQAQAVIWVTGLKDLLSTFFSLLAIWLYSLSAEQFDSRQKRPAWLWYFAATLSFSFAILSKASCIIVPAIAFLLDVVGEGRHWRRSARYLLPWLALAIPVGWLNKTYQPNEELPYIASWWERPLVAGDAMLFYLKKLVFPEPLLIDYARNPPWVLKQPLTRWLWLSIPLLGLALSRLRERRWWLLCLGVFILGVFPTLGFVPFLFQRFSTVADRYVYLAMLAPSLALAALLAVHSRPATWIGSVLAIVIFGYLARQEIPHWQNSRRLYEYTLERQPRSLLSHFNLGPHDIEENRIADGIREFQAAYALDPKDERISVNLLSIYVNQGRWDEAIEIAFRIAEIRNLGSEPYTALGKYLALHHLPDKSAEVFERATLKFPGDATYFNNLGVAEMRAGNIKKAVTSYRQAVKLSASSAETHANLAGALQASGDFEGAEREFRETLSLKPEWLAVQTALAKLLERKSPGSTLDDPSLREAKQRSSLARPPQGR